MSISVDIPQELLAEIKERRWWQGSLIAGIDLFGDGGADDCPQWWVIATQTCNLYNSNFDNVPNFEIVAAARIEKCEAGKSKGDHPRILHVEAQSREGGICLELNIQNRRWCDRKILAKLPAPRFRLTDAKRGSDPNWINNQWLDKFVCWISRSYTRVTLPDQFNEAIRRSKIDDVLKKKLIKHKDDLYGIFLELHSDSEEVYEGPTGEMPPPYLLNIVLVTNENVNPEILKTELLHFLFAEQIKDPENTSARITRAQLARRHKIRMMEADIDSRSVVDISLAELMPLVRYSFVDHLSDSSITIP